MNGESNMEACTLSYVKQIAKGNFLYYSGNPNWGSVTTQRGRKGWGWDGGTRGRRPMYTYG